MRTPKWLFLMVAITAGAPPSCAALTLLERPEMSGDKLHLSPEKAKRIAAEMRQLKEAGLKHSDPNREAPRRAVTAPRTLWATRAATTPPLDR